MYNIKSTRKLEINHFSEVTTIHVDVSLERDDAKENATVLTVSVALKGQETQEDYVVYGNGDQTWANAMASCLAYITPRIKWENCVAISNLVHRVSDYMYTLRKEAELLGWFE